MAPIPNAHGNFEKNDKVNHECDGRSWSVWRCRPSSVLLTFAMRRSAAMTLFVVVYWWVWHWSDRRIWMDGAVFGDGVGKIDLLINRPSAEDERGKSRQWWRKTRMNQKWCVHPTSKQHPAAARICSLIAAVSKTGKGRTSEEDRSACSFRFTPVPVCFVSLFVYESLHSAFWIEKYRMPKDDHRSHVLKN